MTSLLQKINNREATVGIIGLGYVGLPLALTVSEAGYRNVIGFDVDLGKIQQLRDNLSYIKHIDLQRIRNANDKGFQATTDFALIANTDVVILCLPTPLSKHHEPDLHFIRDTLQTCKPYLHQDQLISLESTTYPGTTEEEIVPLVEELGLTPGQDIFVVYSPEREDPGNQEFPTHKIPKVLGGITNACAQAGEAFYGSIVERVVTVSSTKAAEMTKLLENIHRAVNIGLVNEMKMVADKMGINIHEVIDAAATKPFGFTKYTPGPGLGGHCIPIDPYYLTWKAKEYNINTRFIELSGEINRGMPAWVVGKLMDALNDQGKALKGSKILILGIAYKKDIDDARESPAIKIMEILRSKGADVAYSDPHIPVFPKMRDHQFDLQSVELTVENIEGFDAVVLATGHGAFDLGVVGRAALLVDCVNSTLGASYSKISA
ncbi:nucleotide sugar dehydrogenase [Pseudomaricurvus hydrocarbonicus]|nr:nucleotide sugar dehydrogenase [Aestuariicella hydrocarbonica]